MAAWGYCRFTVALITRLGFMFGPMALAFTVKEREESSTVGVVIANVSGVRGT
jgi:hypothetical protein